MPQLRSLLAEARTRRPFSPLLSIAAALAVIGTMAGTILPAPAGASSTTSTTANPAAPAGALSFSQAKAEGKVGSINWGSRCNVATGTLKYPSFFAGACYAPFTGNNGGATTSGVTASTIKVVYYVAQANDPILNYIESAVKDTATNAQNIQTMQDWVTFYNHFFETYGRKVQLIPFTASGVSDDPVSARADAVTIATNIKPFAVWGGPILTTAFADELSARHVLCIDCGSGDTNSYFQQRSPYVWSLGMLPQQSIVHVAEFLKKQVNGKKATFAGESDFKTQKRKFGMIDLVNNADSSSLLKDWQKAFKSDGINVAQYVTYASPTDLQTQAPALIAKLKAAGVTSVIFSGDPVAPQTLTRAATAQNYFPEWIISGSALTDTAAFARTYDQKQWAHAFGVSFGAARTGVTGAIPLYEWYFGHKPPDLTGAAVSMIDASFFFAVLQGIGPDLTAKNYQKAAFAGAPTPHAITQPSLSWGNHGIWSGTDYGGVDDATEVWWNPSISGPDELGRVGPGLYEYVNGGKRYLPGHWPTEPTQAFQKAGAVAIYTTPPPSEKVPNYPSPAQNGS
jgi:Periplasmic binding protein